MKNIYLVTAVHSVEGVSSPNYKTLNKEKAEEVLKLFLEFRPKYPKYDSRFTDSQHADFIKNCNTLNKELSNLIGKSVDLSYLSRHDTIELIIQKLDDDLEATGND